MRANAQTPPTTPPAIPPTDGVLCLAADVGVVEEVLVVEEVVVTGGAVVDDKADVEVDSIDDSYQIKCRVIEKKEKKIKGSSCMHTR